MKCKYFFIKKLFFNKYLYANYPLVQEYGFECGDNWSCIKISRTKSVGNAVRKFCEERNLKYEVTADLFGVIKLY